MALVSMNVTDDDASSVSGPESAYDPSPCVYLSSAQVEALGITVSPGAGTTVKITAIAVVQSVTEYAQDADGDKDISLSLKITDMELGATSTSASKLY